MPTVDVSPAFDLLPNQISVLYAVRTSYPPAVYTVYGGITAYRPRISSHEMEPSGGLYRRFSTSFKLRQQDLNFNAIFPAVGDGVNDGFDWTITSVHKGLANWTVGCVRFTVGSDQVDWRKTNQQTNVFGDRITDPNTFTLGGTFQCRVQPADNTILDQFGKRGALQHYVVYLLSDQQFTYGDLLIQTNANNRKFIIRDWQSRQDIQNAMTILCEVLP